MRRTNLKRLISISAAAIMIVGGIIFSTSSYAESSKGLLNRAVRLTVSAPKQVNKAGINVQSPDDSPYVSVTKTALLAGDPVDEVCGGQTVTFRYVVTNKDSDLFLSNLVDDDPDLGDVDGQAGPFTIPGGQSVTFTKTKFIATGQISSSTVTYTGNQASNGNPGDAVSATATWTVTGLNCDVRLEKTVNSAPPASGQSFTFQVRTGASVNSVGTTIATAVANSANGGTVGIANLQPNTAYQFCEVNLLPGWTSSLSQVAGSFVPNSNSGNADNSVICINFTLNTEQGTVFEVNNSTPPAQGSARTIGYWKNWSSCSPGKQAPILDYVLSTFGSAPAAPPIPLPSPLPAITNGASIGALAVNSCVKGVNILDKSTIGGVKKASNAAYNMAAQLLAAKLNIQAGADPRCIGPVVNEAQQLLLAIGFNGSTVPSFSAAQGSRMNVLATLLDRYNNGDPTLCPIP